MACTGGGSEEDEEAAALEREVEAIRAQDEAAITDGVDRAARDRAKGAAVKSQKALWDRMLEMRILLQRCLQVSAWLTWGSDMRQHTDALRERCQIYIGMQTACSEGVPTCNSHAQLF